MERVGPATGIIGVTVLLIGYSIHGYPPMNATGSQLVSWTQSTDPAVFSLGIYLEAVGIVLFLVFFTWLCAQLWETPSRPWLAAAAFGGALLWGGSSMLENATFAALLSAGRNGVDSHGLAALHAVALNVGSPAGVAMGLASDCNRARLGGPQPARDRGRGLRSFRLDSCGCSTKPHSVACRTCQPAR